MDTLLALQKILESNPQTKEDFLRARDALYREAREQMPPLRELITCYHNARKTGNLPENKTLEIWLKKNSIRSLSGVAIITSLVKPYACPGECIYCPTEVRMPKSYIASEPAAARALRLDFSPYEQMKKRIEALEMNGHPTDKIEYIIKGGTWNAYPLKYQYWFILESFKAANNQSREVPEPQTTENHWKDRPLSDLIAEVNSEHTYNETAKHRIIGLTLETRPDAIAGKTLLHMRNQGCTRVELGLQAPDDRILSLVKRGHTVEDFRHAMELLRDVGFKVDLHFMPDLPGTTPNHDVEMYESLFTDIGLKPDMVKIYPNTVIKSAELYEWFLDGRYKPYGEKELFNALLQMKQKTPRYCRISRLIRDIPEQEITAGNSITNLREALEKQLHAEGKKCLCLRCREIGRMKTKLSKNADSAPTLFIDTYSTRGGEEYFISFETKEREAVYGFLRLRIPEKKENIPEWKKQFFPELADTAFIRELHVYGMLVKIGEQNELAAQHTGLGKKLVAEAEKIAKEHGYEHLAVISGVGVRGYYQKLGYQKEGTYVIKKI